MRETIKVLFVSASEELIPEAVERMQKLLPELPLVVVSEFPVAGVRWLPFPLARGFWENLALFRWHFREKRIRLCAVVLQPSVPYWRMRLIAFLLSPWNFLAFNENFGHFMLRPRSLPTIVRHFRWRVRNFVVWQRTRGAVHAVELWLKDADERRRSVQIVLAHLGGLFAAGAKRLLPTRTIQPPLATARPRGVSVIIPSRNGKELLIRLLPEAIRQIHAIGGEIIVVDNGSDDGTAEFLRASHPGVVIDEHSKPLSFSRAVNAGIRKARYSHVCLLNNDMAIADDFFSALLEAFARVPDLFSATAQIFFPEDARREETGKAVMPLASQRQPTEFPLRCELPFPGEDFSYVLYGSGGCSLFDAGKLAALGGLDDIYEPAYVEDLDLGFRGWQLGWPSVFVAAAQVIHEHRATTSRYYSEDFIDRMIELNYLRFLARTVAEPRVLLQLWGAAIRRLRLLTANQSLNVAARAALKEASKAPLWLTRRPPAVLSDGEILALGSGNVIVFPGRPPRRKPVVMIVSPYLPFPLSHGGAVRMYNLMRRAAADFDQVLISFADASIDVPAELLDICSEIVLVRRSGTHLFRSTARPDVVEEFDSPAFHAALRQTVRKWKPALAQLEFTQMAQYASDCPPAKTILVEHDITFDLYQQLLAGGDDWELRRQLERWIPFETAAWPRFDRIVTMSEKDRALAIAKGAAPAATKTLPNGVDLHRFQPASGLADTRRALFIGSFAHLPNVLAVDFFLREVWPHLVGLGGALHIIAGARHQYHLDRYRDRAQLNLDQPGIEVEDFVADVRPAYERATLVVAPLVASAGTNIKILEAMAMGKAIVSTAAGINGLDLNPGTDVIVAASGPEMAKAIRALFENPYRRYAIEEEARKTVERQFGWDSIAEQQLSIYRELLD